MEEKNKVEVSIELVGADEVIQKLQEIEKLLNDIASIKIKDKSLSDLRQKLINYLYNLKSYESNDIELIKILFEYEKIR